ncbi:hypothetical protein [Caulobacter sp. NIBR1757]|uniref:hypothetical protein n=1 Tax=Caulobacter sp. NIBR1757 TaxID=3016000 RepID=UPI0022F06CC2|nr:hypothetical protein [Caulobacter sp. NIBR1757]WGM39778.1 hypothetical protein AMEJIAPC_02705 [Caulobacter sp. NIBR1757]
MTYQPGEPRIVYDETPRTVAIEPRRNNTAAWIAAALVAVVAIIAVAFMVASANRDAALTQEDLSTVAEQARAQGALEGAQAGYNAAATQAQSTYNAAAANAQLAADRSAAEARAAAAETRAAAERARAEAAEAAAARDPAPIEEPLPLN